MRCSITSCGSPKGPGVTIHRFPKSKSLRSKWVKAIGFKNMNSDFKDIQICSKHFEDSCFKRTRNIVRLCDDSVPTLHLQGDSKLPISMRLCKICLCLDAKMYNITEFNLDEMYLNVLGMKPRLDEWLPQGVCWECAARLSAADSFRAKAMLADAVLTEESLNLADILKIQREYKSLKSTLAIQNVFNSQIVDYQKPNSMVKAGNIDNPHNDKTDGMEVNKIVNHIIIKIENNNLFEECTNAEYDDVKAEADLVPTTEVGTTHTEVEIPQQDSDYFEDNNFSETEDTGTKNINETIRKEHDKNADDLVYLFVLDNNENKLVNNEFLKKYDDDDENLLHDEQDDVVNISSHLEKIYTPNLEEKKPYKRSSVQEDDQYPDNSISYRSSNVPSPDTSQGIRKQKNGPAQGVKKPDIHRPNVNINTMYRAPVTCEQCGVELENFRAYEKHFRNVHPNVSLTQYPSDRNLFMCEQCGKMFWKKHSLLMHISIHNTCSEDQRRAECDYCHKLFSTKYSLENHIRQQHLPSLRRIYPCKICGKSYDYPSNVKRHMLVHSDERKPVKCDLCDKEFLYSSYLRNHVDHVHRKKPWPKRVQQRSNKFSFRILSY